MGLCMISWPYIITNYIFAVCVCVCARVLGSVARKEKDLRLRYRRTTCHSLAYYTPGPGLRVCVCEHTISFINRIMAHTHFMCRLIITWHLRTEYSTDIRHLHDHYSHAIPFAGLAFLTYFNPDSALATATSTAAAAAVAAAAAAATTTPPAAGALLDKPSLQGVSDFMHPAVIRKTAISTPAASHTSDGGLCVCGWREFGGGRRLVQLNIQCVVRDVCIV